MKKFCETRANKHCEREPHIHIKEMHIHMRETEVKKEEEVK
jgi:hypothetical protein